MHRREFLKGTLGGAALVALRSPAQAAAPASASISKIDMHVHLGRSQQEMGQMTREKLPDAVKYLTGEMDRHKVERALIVAVEPAFPTEIYLDAAKLEPKRLIVACSVLPRPENLALEKLRAFHERGAKALKLQPMQYDPHDPAVERLVSEAVRLGMPVLFHHTDLPRSFADMLAHFASIFPAGNFVVIHFGGVYGFWDVLPLARMPNVYLETSTAFPRLVKSPLRPMLHFLVEEKHLDKLVFGSELPGEYEHVIGAIDELLGPDAGPDVAKAIYRRNAERLLKLTISAEARSDEAERERYQKLPEIFQALGVKAGSRIADVGAGPGFFTVRLASAVQNSGRVYAVDVNQRVIERLQRRVKEDELENVEVINGDAGDPKLPKKTLDGVLIVDAYHEFVEYQSMLSHLLQSLKSGGSMVILDHSPAGEAVGAPRSKQVSGHQIATNLVEQELKQAGFTVESIRPQFATEGSDTVQWMIVARRP